MRLHVCKLDPIPYYRGPKAEYLGFIDGECRHRFPCQPADDVGALQAMIERFPNVTDRTCSVELAAAGVVLGFVPEDTPAPLLEERAAAAMECAELASENWSATTFRALFAAAKAFMGTRAWEGWKLGERVRARYTYESSGESHDLTCVIRCGDGDHPDGPALFVEDDGPWSKRIGGGREAPMRLTARLTDWPDFAVRAVDDAIGLAIYPRITASFDGCLVPTTTGHILLLAAAMAAVAALATGGSKPTTEAATDEIQIRFFIDSPKRLPPRNLYATNPRAARRERARGSAMVLLAESDPGSLDDVVCLLLNDEDPVARLLHGTMLSVSMGISGDEAEARIAAELKEKRGKRANADSRVALWGPASIIADLLVEHIGPAIGDHLRRVIRPGTVRILEIAPGIRHCYEVEYEPREVARARAELEEHDRMADVLDRFERARAAAPPDPKPAPPFEGTWRDARRYLPEQMPDTWTIAEIAASGAHHVAVRDGCRFQIGAREEDGEKSVTVLFQPHQDGTKAADNKTRDVIEKLRSCGRFIEMAILIDGAPVPMVGMRAFSAPLAKKRPVPRGVHGRSDAAQAELIERTKPHLGEIVQRAHADRRPMSDYCVVIGAEPSAKDPVDGIVVTRELIAKIFVNKETDPFDIRGRFDEPRPETECVVFVKHDDGIEEIHVSLDSLQVAPTSDA